MTSDPDAAHYSEVSVKSKPFGPDPSTIESLSTKVFMVYRERHADYDRKVSDAKFDLAVSAIMKRIQGSRSVYGNDDITISESELLALDELNPSQEAAVYQD